MFHDSESGQNGSLLFGSNLCWLKPLSLPRPKSGSLETRLRGWLRNYLQGFENKEGGGGGIY